MRDELNGNPYVRLQLRGFLRNHSQDSVVGLDLDANVSYWGVCLSTVNCCLLNRSRNVSVRCFVSQGFTTYTTFKAIVRCEKSLRNDSRREAWRPMDGG